MKQHGHPQGLYLLFVTEMAERFSYYGMRAIFISLLQQCRGIASIWLLHGTRLSDPSAWRIHIRPLLG